MKKVRFLRSKQMARTNKEYVFGKKCIRNDLGGLAFDDC